MSYQVLLFFSIEIVNSLHNQIKKNGDIQPDWVWVNNCKILVPYLLILNLFFNIT